MANQSRDTLAFGSAAHSDAGAPPVNPAKESWLRIRIAPRPAGWPKPSCIYALVDPETDEVRYIGKTNQLLSARLGAHLLERANCHRCHWIAQLAARELKPRIEVLETIEGLMPWQPSEIFWIAWAQRNGARLTNNTSGGDGVPNLPAATRERMRNVWLGRKHSEETLQKLRVARRSRVTTDATKLKMSATMKGRKITWTDKISEANRKIDVAQLETIKARIAAGELVKDIAVEFGVHRTTISKIKMGKYLK